MAQPFTAPQEMLATLSQIFTNTLNPATQKQAEATLRDLERQPNAHLPLLLLSLIAAVEQFDSSVRLAAAIQLKNICRRAWASEEALLEAAEESGVELVSPEDRVQLKASLLPLLLDLSQPTKIAASPSALRLQLSEAIALIAAADFPAEWPTLIDDLTASLASPPDSPALQSVLQTTHSIFRGWRSAFRSNELYTEINLVLDRFAQPFLELVKRTDEALATAQTQSATTISSTMLLSLQIYHDLSAQDLPPLFEDNLASISSLFLRYLNPRSAAFNGIYLQNANIAGPLEGDEDEASPQNGQLIRAEICSIAELYAQRYLDAFGASVPDFVRAVWEMLGQAGKAEKEDLLVSQAITFLSTIVKVPSQKENFSGEGTIEALVEAIVLPNIALREQDEELFQDEPLEWIRREFALESADTDTRRQAASNFTRALLDQFSDRTTQVVSRHIGQYLEQYRSDSTAHWRQKDAAIYLLTSIASTSSTAAKGVSSTNSLIDVVGFFTDHVLVDLQSDPSSVNPILQVDAIKYLHTFRNQLTKEQLLSVLPLLVRHLESESYVTSTYAAITIERVLFLKSPTDGRRLLFTSSDVQPFAESILMALFKNIERGQTPEKVAENDYLIKCVMRLIATSREAMIPIRQPVLKHLTDILVEITKNPSNPRFTQYLFESISTLVRFVTAGDSSTIGEFEQALSGPFMSILQNDVAEFIPFVFQILSQMLELHQGTELPGSYVSLLPSLLTPALWSSRGNIPALVRLLQAFLSRGARQMVEANQVSALLGIYQTLIASRLNDEYGFELLTSIFDNVEPQQLDQYKAAVLTLMLTRLQSSRTEKFSRGFVAFVGAICSIQQPGYPDYVVSAFDAVQPGLFPQILQGVLLPELAKVPPRQRRSVAVGLTRLLTKSEAMLNPPNVSAWAPTLTSVLKLVFDESSVLSKKPSAKDGGSGGAAAAQGADDDDIFAQDWEENQGFQSSFSLLAASRTSASDGDAKRTAFAGPDVGAYVARAVGELMQGPAASKVAPALAQVPEPLMAELRKYG